jgi:hypothetical protein
MKQPRDWPYTENGKLVIDTRFNADSLAERPESLQRWKTWHKIGDILHESGAFRRDWPVHPYSPVEVERVEFVPTIPPEPVKMDGPRNLWQTVRLWWNGFRP